MGARVRDSGGQGPPLALAGALRRTARCYTESERERSVDPEHIFLEERSVCAIVMRGVRDCPPCRELVARY